MPLPRGSKKSEKTRKYQNEYAKQKYKVAACQISLEKYNAFSGYAASQGKTVSKLLSEYIDLCLADPGRNE